MKRILALVVAFCLPGCVGYTFSKDSDIVVGKDMSTVDLLYRDKKPNRLADKTNPDGSEGYILKNERKWCGLTIFMIIPIPLWLPVCRNYIEVTYKDGKPIEVTRQWPITFGFGCGPYMGFGGGPQDFCQ